MRAEQQKARGESSASGSSLRRDASIVVVSWNAKTHLLDCLRSIENDPGIEVIVVDNASADGSADAVAHEFPRVLLVRNPSNLGFARACNIGIGMASGAYVFLVNSDAVARPGAIRTLIRFMDDRPRVGLAGPRVLNPDGSLQPSCRTFPGVFTNTCSALALPRLFPRSQRLSGEQMLHWSHDRERSVDAISGCFVVARVEAVRQVGALDEEFFLYGEDVDWCMRFHDAGWDVRFCPTAEVVHVRGASSANDGRRFVGEMLTSTAKLYRKHYRRPVAIYLSLVAVLHHLVRLVARSILWVLLPPHRDSLRTKIDAHLAGLRWLLRARN